MHQKSKKIEYAKAYTQLLLMFYALLAIWAAYVLNLFDDLVPYIVGPILYTVVAYTISFVIFKRGYVSEHQQQEKYQTTVVSDERIDQLFAKISQLIIEEKQFKKRDLSLKLLSQELNITPQILSMVINKKTAQNFNSFINQLRIEEAVQLLESKEYAAHTIASISFEAGFNSISSFNVAFKKYKGTTPTVFRKNLPK